MLPGNERKKRDTMQMNREKLPTLPDFEQKTIIIIQHENHQDKPLRLIY